MLLTLLSATWFAPQGALAQDIEMKGIMTGPKGSAKGRITVSGTAITVEKRGLFKQLTISYSFGEMESLTVRTGFLRKGNIVIHLRGQDQPLRLIVKGKQAKRAREYLQGRIASR